METINLIPRERSFTPKKGTFTCTGTPEIFGDADFLSEIELFKQSLKNLPLTVGDNPKNIICTVDTTCTEKEAYILEIENQTITVKASSSHGIFNGLQSIKQLILANVSNNSFSIPQGTITDGPRFAWRGLMLDTSRHFYSVSFLKKLIDLAALHHFNVFHWHLTDDQGWRLPVEKYPLLTEIGAWRKDYKTTWDPSKKIGGFYSHQEIKEIVSYAQARHIEIVPEVDLPGHASAILAAYPELGCTGGPYQVEDRYGIFEDVLCAGNDAIFDLFSAIFDTLTELFPSKFVHIGGDEVKFARWEACPKCNTRKQKLGLDHIPQLQSWITVELVKMLADRGKTAIGWDEVLEGTEKMGLPQDLIVMSWRGQEGGIKASAMGHRVIMTPLTDGCYLNFKPLDNDEEPGHLEVCTTKRSYQMDPITQDMTPEQTNLILGGQANLWSEVIYASKIAEYMLFPRMCAIAESLWSPKEVRSLDSFAQRLPCHQKKLDLLNVCQFKGPLE